MYKKIFKFNSKFKDECRKSQKPGNQTIEKNLLEHQKNLSKKFSQKSNHIVQKKVHIFY